MNADPSQFIIELPESMKFDLKNHYFENLYSDFKYYLAIYNEEEIKAIVNAMAFIIRRGFSVKYRPHPNYSDVNLLKKYVSDDEIEFPKVSILDSISSTKHVVGVYSTVLTQAFFNGQNVIIDDVAFRSQYNALKDLQYILIDKVEVDYILNVGVAGGIDKSLNVMDIVIASHLVQQGTVQYPYLPLPHCQYHCNTRANSDRKTWCRHTVRTL